MLVKAYPQASQKYEETVCVAAVTEDGRLIRLYPIRYRHLDEAQRFERFDWIEADMARAVEDPRPESVKVKEDSIRIVKTGRSQTPEEKVRVWKSCVVESLEALKVAQKAEQRSLGIVRPVHGSVRFKYQPIAAADDEAQTTARSVYQQQSLLERSLDALPTPEFVFRYQFDSGGHQHTMQLHDWEAETTFHKYRRRYGSTEAALEKMHEFYNDLAPTKSLHLIMGNMHKRPWQFIVIGVLRTSADVDKADAQASLLI